MNSRRLNILGLCLGMLGVIVLFFWGPPQPTLEPGVGLTADEGSVIDKKTGKTTPDYNQEIKSKRRLYDWMSKFGLGLVGAGFFFQFWTVLRSK
jgi:hypothetical protein